MYGTSVRIIGHKRFTLPEHTNFPFSESPYDASNLETSENETVENVTRLR
jgi:hypothetical protein